MIIIGADVVESYFANHAGHRGIKAARSQYDAWLDIVTRAEWHNPEDVKASYPKASILKGSRVVFNIKGNDYRLIARVQYQAGLLAIRFFGTHAEYDRIDACGGSVGGCPPLCLLYVDRDPARARALVERVWDSNTPADIARLEAQA